MSLLFSVTYTYTNSCHYYFPYLIPIQIPGCYTFHVLMLRKYIPDPSNVLREQPVQLKENLTYEETPVQIVEFKEQVLRSKVIPLVKVLWKNHEREAATWEPEVQMRR